ncbi:alcohol dehydrogenase-like regulatory protein ErcA [Desulfogranum japonicum]|uniref:alcohol dehydrogenase-like regulatory protein ErcA n=1 Tax=Desulfogranum japonicum TaxID=231447 RepID=UPI00048CBCB2|nr:alcohol dehydrogenase-like regulatory protein ErcA [Desulfogranum japonicum]
MSQLRKFVIPELVFGDGAVHVLGRYANNFGSEKVLIVTDAGLIATPWVDKAVDLLREEGIASVVFSDVSPNPRDFQVHAGAEMYHKAGCDIIIAVGGGSAMDCAKGIGILATNEGGISSFQGVDNVKVPCPPLICIPTTAGTSADVSQFAIISDSAEQVKMAIISKTMVPDVALIDPRLTMTMDPALTAHTGIDALVHAVEAYVSTGNSALTDVHALKAIELILKYLPKVVKEPDSYAWREKVMFASLHAGLAFSNASLGAVHAMAHSLGGTLDLAHGECNALLLEHVVAYNYSYAVERYERIGKIVEIGLGMQEVSGVEAICQGFRRFREHMGVKGGLGQRGVSSENIPVLAEKAMSDPCLVTNPHFPNQRELEEIYEKAL